MTPKLREAIAEIVAEVGQSVAERVAALIADQPLSELTGLSGGIVPASPTRAVRAKKAAGGRMAKRSAEDIEEVIQQVAAALKGEKEGLSSEQLQDKLNLSKKEIQRPIILALQQKRIFKSGEKRAARYFDPHVAAGATTKASMKPSKKASRKPKKAAGATKVKVKTVAKPASKASAKPTAKKAAAHKTNSAPAATTAAPAAETAVD
jgi:hypothetical protein